MNKITKLRQFIDNRLEWDLGSDPAVDFPKQSKSPVFILCPARSGSTLLRVMLGGSPGLFAPPELELLSFSNLKNRREGLSIRLSYMLEGLVRAVMALKNCEAEEARAVLREYEEQGMSTAAFYALLQEWCEGRQLVDKSVHYAMSPRILERAEQYFENARYIHLSRHPYGTAHSIESLRMDKDLYGPITGYRPRELAEYTWQICHENIFSFLQGVPKERQIHVRFEELVTSPEATMRELCGFLQIPFHEDMLHPYRDKQKRMTDEATGSVMVGDPRFHQHKKIEARAAESWKEGSEPFELTEGSRGPAGRLRYWDAGIPRAVERNWLEKSNLSLREWRAWLGERQWAEGHRIWSTTRRFALPAGVEAKAFHKAFGEAVRQTELLHCVYREEGGFPQRRILPGLETAVEVWETGGPLEELDRRFAGRPLDRSRKCFDSIMARSESGRWYWYLKLHELIAPNGDFQWLLNRLAEAWQHLTAGEVPELPPVLTGSKGSTGGEASRPGGVYEAGAQYWQGQALPGVLQWYGKAKKGDSTKTNRYAIALSPELASLLDNGANFPENGNRDTALATALAVFISRVADVDQVAVGLPASEDTPLPVMAKVEKGQSLQSLHEQVCEEYQTALRHLDYPFLNPAERPLFHAAIRYERPVALQLNGDNLDSELLGHGHRAEALTLIVREENQPGPARIELEGCRELFPGQWLELAAGHFSQVLTDVLTQADLPAAEISLLTGREAVLLEKWNDTQSDYPQDKTVVCLFEEQVEKTPDNIAVVFEDRALTYRELNEKANQVGHYLREAYYIRPDDVIALQLERSEWMIIAILGVLKAGAAYLPIAPDAPAAGVRYMLEDSRARALLTDEATYAVVKELEEIVAVEVVQEMDTTGRPPSTVPAFEKKRDSPSNLAYIIYTSGSTGQPKGVMVEHRGVVNM
ncbi:MAG: AMP-binding protein, partial [Phaeodactylibacter sp.]|nr:AMP-binding protein [Phaeodactylibacter sp.]